MSVRATKEMDDDLARLFDEQDEQDELVSDADEDAVVRYHAAPADPEMRRKQLGIAPTSATGSNDVRAADPERDDLAVELPTTIIARWRAEGALVHKPTELHTLDDLTRGGFVFGRRVYFVGAPGSGKTGVANMIGAVYLRAGLVVGVLAVDEDPEDVLTRHVQMLAGYFQSDCERRDPLALDDIEERLAPFAERLRFYGARTAIEDAAADVAATAARLKTRGALIVDSIQTARTSAENDDQGDRERIEERVHVIRDVTRAHQLITLVTSEMNRGGYASRTVAERSNDLATAKGASAIEYSAQVLLALRSIPDEPDLVHVTVAKNRGGKLGEFHLRLDRARHEFTEVMAPASDDDASTEEAREACTLDAAHVAAVIARAQGIVTRELHAALRAEHGTFPRDRAYAAVARLGAGCVRVPGPRSAEHHYVDGSKVAEEILAAVPLDARAAVANARPPQSVTAGTEETPS